MTKKIVTTALLLITPLIFIPNTLNFFTTNKLVFVILAALTLLIAATTEHLTTKKHLHQSSFFTLTLGLFWAAIGLDFIMTKEAKVEGMVLKGGLLLALTIIAYLLSTAKKSTQNLRWALTSLVVAGTTLAIHSIAQLVVLAEITALPSWMETITFTPAGSILILITTLIFTFVSTLAWAIQEKELTKKTSLFTAAGVQLAALVAYGFMIGQGEIIIQLLPLKAGWALTLDALKNARELVFGVGLANFPVLFTQFKPSFLTQTDLWTTIFQTSSNEILHLLATTGLIGFSAFILLLISTVKNSLRLEKSALNNTLKLTVYAIILSFFLVPANIITYTFFFTLAGLIAAESRGEARREINLPGYSSIATAIALSVVVIFSGYFTYRVYAAEVYMRQAQIDFAKNDAEGVYINHIKAVQLMPQLTDYRVSLSQINMTLASSLSQIQAADPEVGGPTELTEQQREQVSALIQRSIEQGQVAAQLRPSLYSTWKNLGGIYRNLINVADGAENFAIQYFGQAIVKDPANPLLRIEYGGLFYQLAQLVQDEETKLSLLDQSIIQFQAAVNLRPDHANAYYNLANIFDQKGSYRLAYQSMTQALANIDPNSPDYQKAQNELLVLEKKLPQAPEQQPAEIITEQPEKSQLQQPAPLPSPLPGGPVDLPEVVELPEVELPIESTSSASPTSEPAQQ
jgi:tetratricopeptide (TPR) repeat protein